LSIGTGMPTPHRRGDLPVRVEPRFERLPTSIRGAFLLRGADGNPHAVRFEWARVARLPGGPAREVPVEDRVFDVAPTHDLFVPFETLLADLDPGWYAVRASVQVDGGRSYRFEGRPFAVPWPRDQVRRGTVVVDRTVEAGGLRFTIERVDLGGDCAVVAWRPVGPGGRRRPAARRGEARPTGDGQPDRESQPGGEGEAAEGPAGSQGARAVLLADGTPLEEIPAEAGPRQAHPRGREEGRTVTYPVPRACRRLAVAVRLPSGEQSRPLPVPLP
jgi:hypothetical protein